MLLPLCLGAVGVTGYVANAVGQRYLNQALIRSVGLIVLGQANALESAIDEARLELVVRARNSISPEGLARFLEERRQTHHGLLREAAFIGQRPGQDCLVVAGGEETFFTDPAELALVRPSLLDLVKLGADLGVGEVGITECGQAVYPNHRRASREATGSPVIRLYTQAQIDGNPGVLVLGLDVGRLRDLLSLYNTPRSPLWAFDRATEHRFSFFYDVSGWMLFQSEPDESPGRKISLERARAGLTGDHSRPGLESSFRPHGRHTDYWKLVAETAQGRHGVTPLEEGGIGSAIFRDESAYIGYAPVGFHPGGGKPAQIIGGVAFVDTSVLPTKAEMFQFNTLFVVALISCTVLAAAILVVAKAVSNPLSRLEKAVDAIEAEGRLQALRIEHPDRETWRLMNTINSMIEAVLAGRAEVQRHEQALENVLRRQPAALEAKSLAAMDATQREVLLSDPLAVIVGASPAMEELRAALRKAAATDADVLVIGETGTGKELVAEAIHRLSRRSQGPFVSVNCGALDENLLLDELFGHVKGAFTEARGSRKGAFETAVGGTLFLDEIGNASPKVQQALLRVLSTRRFSPLGSSESLEVNVRVIAATNVDLLTESASGRFREDLYYRLAVLRLTTPPLRDRRSDIPLLARHFLAEAALAQGKAVAKLSRGALERILEHPWPGNVRELKNALTRGLAMAEGDVIQLEDLLAGQREAADVPPLAGQLAGGALARPLGRHHGASKQPQETRESHEQAPPPRETPQSQGFDGLKPRQRAALSVLASRASFTRSDYQSLLPSGLPDRTAQNDLRELIEAGLVRRVGKGPASRYEPTQAASGDTRS